MSQPAGPILDGLGVTFDLDEGDLVATAVVLSKVLCADGTVSMMIGTSEGSTWLEHLGLITAAADLIRPSRWRGAGTLAYGEPEDDE